MRWCRHTAQQQEAGAPGLILGAPARFCGRIASVADPHAADHIAIAIPYPLAADGAARPIGLRPGVDPTPALRLADALEDEEIVRKLALRK